MKKITLMLTLLLSVLGAKADVEWTIWQGSHTFGNWSGNYYIDESLFSCLEVGDVLYGEIENVIEKDGDTNLWPQTCYKFSMNYDPWSWEDTQYTIAALKESDTSFSLPITSEILTKIASHYNMQIYGAYFTLKKLVVKKQKSAIKKDLGIESFSTGDYVNGKNIDPALFTNTVAGDYVVIDGTMDSNNNNQWNLSTSYPNTWYVTLGNIGGAWFKVTDDNLTHLNTEWGWITGKNNTLSGLYLYHPINSFAIGATGLATFSANQEVTAPNIVTAYKATISGSNVQLTPFTNNVIPANTGAIIAGDKGAVLEFLASSTGSTETSNLLSVASATEVTTLAESGYDLYVLYNNATKNSKALGLGDSDLNSKWGDGTTYASKVITFTEAWKGCGWWFSDSGVDYSAYDRVEATFTSEQSGRLVVDYADGTQSYTNYAANSTLVTVTLDKNKRNIVKAIYFCSSEASCQITLSNVSLYGTVAEFRKTTSGTLAANKAYLKIASGSSAPSLSISFDDNNSATGISTPKAVVTNDNRIFNLNGQEVKTATRGIFIKNGKKYIVK